MILMIGIAFLIALMVVVLLFRNERKRMQAFRDEQEALEKRAFEDVQKLLLELKLRRRPR